MKKLTYIIGILILTSYLFANVGRPVAYYGPKKSGMGGTGVAVVDKRESLYYNPAHVVDIDSNLTLPIIQGTPFLGSDTIANISKLAVSGDQNDVVSNYRNIIPTKLGLGYNTSGQWIGNIGVGSLGIGMYANNKIGANIVNRLSPRFEAIGGSDIVFPTITYGTPLNTLMEIPDDFVLKNIKTGVTLKNINRYSLCGTNGEETLSLELLNLIDENNQSGLNYRVGHGVGLDIGFLADMDTFVGPAKLGLAITNISTRITGYQYNNQNSDKTKDQFAYYQDIPLLATLGLSTKASPFVGVPVLDTVFPDATYAADWDVISQDTSFFKRLHLGLEQNYLNDLMAWRMGLNQGYPTMGMNFNFWAYHIGLTWFTEEYGTEIGQNPQSFWLLDGGFYW